jgi:predicted ATPase
MLDWSYNLLTPLEQPVLVRLSIFSGEFTLSAAQKVLGDGLFDELEIAQALNSLVVKSLVHAASRDGDAFHRLLDTTRAYAMLKLEQGGDLHSLARCHALYCCELLSRQNESGPGEVSARKAIHTDIRAALAWCFCRYGDSAIGVELAKLAAPVLAGNAGSQYRESIISLHAAAPGIRNLESQI